MCEACLLSSVGGHRTCTCAALGQGAQLVQVSRQLFMTFVLARPRTLQIYLHKVTHPPLGLLFLILYPPCTPLSTSVRVPFHSVPVFCPTDGVPVLFFWYLLTLN